MFYQIKLTTPGEKEKELWLEIGSFWIGLLGANVDDVKLYNNL